MTREEFKESVSKAMVELAADLDQCGDDRAAAASKADAALERLAVEVFDTHFSAR